MTDTSIITLCKQLTPSPITSNAHVLSTFSRAWQPSVEASFAEAAGAVVASAGIPKTLAATGTRIDPKPAGGSTVAPPVVEVEETDGDQAVKIANFHFLRKEPSRAEWGRYYEVATSGDHSIARPPLTQAELDLLEGRKSGPAQKRDAVVRTCSRMLRNLLTFDGMPRPVSALYGAGLLRHLQRANMKLVQFPGPELPMDHKEAARPPLTDDYKELFPWNALLWIYAMVIGFPHPENPELDPDYQMQAVPRADGDGKLQCPEF